MSERKYPSLAGIFFRAMGLFMLLNFLAHSPRARAQFWEGFHDAKHDRPFDCETCGR